MTAAAKRIEHRAEFNFLRYGNVWEDADILCLALKPRAKGGRLLSVASAGDNCLGLLTLDPKEVLAVDLNPAQLACTDLKKAAFQGLDHAGLLAFLGVTENPKRLEAYAGLRGGLAPESAAFWDARPGAIQAGIIHSGRLEKFLRLYQRVLRFFVHGPAKIEGLLKAQGMAAQRTYFSGTWDSWGWRLLNRAAFSRPIMGRLGRDSAFFLHAGEDVTSGPSRRLKETLLGRPLHGNPYLRYQLTGNYSPSALPLYLRPSNFKAIRARSARIRLHLGNVESAPGRFDGFNLSNIFEYMDPAQHEATYAGLLAKARPGARLCYWNLHVERPSPPALGPKVRPLRSLSASLHARDRYWAYRSFHVDQVPAKNQ